MQTGFGKLRGGRTLDRWGAGGEDDAWWSVGTIVRGDRHGLARKVRHDPGLPHPNQRGSRANTNVGMRDRNRRECDREMVMSVAYESGRARCLAMEVNARELVDATLTASEQFPLP